MTRIAGSGEGSETNIQRYGSADPDPHQNVTTPQHWCKVNIKSGSVISVYRNQLKERSLMARVP
jgi:hypothetical protein